MICTEFELSATFIWQTHRVMHHAGRKVVIEPILVLNLVRARSSWLGLGTEPPADRSPIRRRIVWMRHSAHCRPQAKKWGKISEKREYTVGMWNDVWLTEHSLQIPASDIEVHNRWLNFHSWTFWSKFYGKRWSYRITQSRARSKESGETEHSVHGAEAESPSTG